MKERTSKTRAVYLSDETWKALKYLANKSNRSISNYISCIAKENYDTEADEEKESR